MICDSCLDFLEEVQFDRVGVFAYSAQEGTRAAQLPDDVPEVLKRERLERVVDRQRLITAERYDALVGTRAEAIVDWPEGETSDTAGAQRAGARARLACQADDIDGITFLDRRDVPAGSIVEVRVRRCGGRRRLRGERAASGERPSALCASLSVEPCCRWQLCRPRWGVSAGDDRARSPSHESRRGGAGPPAQSVDGPPQPRSWRGRGPYSPAASTRRCGRSVGLEASRSSLHAAKGRASGMSRAASTSTMCYRGAR